SSAAPDARAATLAPRPSPPGAPALHAGGSQDAASADANDRDHAGSARERGSSGKHKSPRQRDALPHGGGARGKSDHGRGGGPGSTTRREPPRRALDERRAGALLAALRKLQREVEDGAPSERSVGEALRALRPPQHTTRPLSRGTG
ncbi:MAG TPA: hypothetical protein VGR11_08845, partial [Solirubrobacteraceae bacterium]|nr:hypothetical protein [Solirubrobacteraceae bacterium]